ncbi:hypothetical protein D0T49_06680 [Paludibacter sp. 221]|uniref:RICIN domain-containing protein n=1 Tax=Paludibacter sp. 221 TaxID=2302939 RepID=UPI0013D064B5|nr:RICIN domain-containing protein [Paludibacter sp. 221]NDV46730.1 hypothetical protein [Paludibacter sp. 221]
MKRSVFYFILLLALIFIPEIKAQLPETSTADSPVWYYIQVTGEGERAGRVFTTIANDTKVYGRAVIYTDDQSQKDTQWWRFEKTGSQYRVINKATGKQLDIAYDSSKSISHAALATESSATFSFEAYDDYYNIKSSKAASGGGDSNVYAHQANDYGSRNYVVMFESSAYNNTANSQFSFILAENLDNDSDFLPEDSSADNPVWYHIQVLGEGVRANRVYTVEGDEVYGRPTATSIKPIDVDPQLWRFEKTGEEYDIINKATGKKLEISYAAAPRNINITTVSDAPKTKWKFSRVNKNYCQIVATVPPTGGKAAEVYAHQANSADGVRDFVIMFVDTQWNTESNSYFRFVAYEDPNVEISTDEKSVWYFITNTQENYKDKAITDVASQGKPYVKFSIEDVDKKNKSQYWKAVKVSTDPADERVQFVNKATGNIIQTNSVQEGIFSYVQYTTDFTDSDGWLLNYIGDMQYEISGKEKDGATRYLYVGNNTSTYPEVYIKNSKNSGFAWTFVHTGEITTDIPSVDSDNIVVYTRNRKIIVVGCDDFTVWNINGIQVNKDYELPEGVYLVKADGKVAKVLVK